MNDTSPEMEKMQFDLMFELGAGKRIELACEMFMAARELILASLPKDIFDRRKKEIYYKKMYGEKLPGDFFESRKSRI